MSIPNSGSAWSNFEAALARVLREFPGRTFLIIAAPTPEFPLVQFAVGTPADPEALIAEVCDGDYSADFRAELQASQFALLEAPPNWVRVLGFPSPSRPYADVARACVRAFREGFGLPGPDSLRYWAWRNAEPMQPGRTYQPDELDPGARDVEFPELGLRYERLFG